MLVATELYPLNKKLFNGTAAWQLNAKQGHNHPSNQGAIVQPVRQLLLLDTQRIEYKAHWLFHLLLNCLGHLSCNTTGHAKYKDLYTNL